MFYILYKLNTLCIKEERISEFILNKKHDSCYFKYKFKSLDEAFKAMEDGKFTQFCEKDGEYFYINKDLACFIETETGIRVWEAQV